MNINSVTSILLLAVLLAGASCSGPDASPEEEGEPSTVPVARAELRSYPQSYQFSGSVSGERRVNLGTKVMGKVSKLAVGKGDRVHRGQVLIRIKNDQVRAQLRQVKASLSEARTTFENTRKNFRRIKALYDDSSATRKELDDIETRLEVARSRVAALESKLSEVEDLLDYTVIESPIEGYVVGKYYEEGDLATPGQPLLTVEEVDRLEVTATVPESRIGLFTAGDTTTVIVPAAKRRFRGLVASVNPSGDRMSRQFEVKIQVPRAVAETGYLKPGMYVRVLLYKGSSVALSVPLSALVSRGQLEGLYVVGGENELVLRWIRTGREWEGRVEVLSGLSEGEFYVTSHEMKLREGQQVTIQ